MKKILSFLLIFLMATPVLAESIDIYDLSYEEKVSLHAQLSKILSDVFTLKPGIYEVGRDIKPGTYRFMYDTGCDFFTRIRIGNDVNVSKTDLLYDRQKFDLYDPYGSSYWFQTTEAYYRLKEGDYIIVELNNVRMEPAQRELTW